MGMVAKIEGNKLYQEVFKGLKITDQQLMFVIDYIANGMSATKAYDYAGYKSTNPKYKSSNASCVRHKKEVAEAIDRFLNHCFKNRRAEFRDKLLGALDNDAFFDVTEILNMDGSPVYMDQLEYTPEQRRRVESIIPRRYGRDGTIEVAEIKLVDRSQARKDIMRLFELTGRSNGSGSIDVNVNSGGSAPVINVNIAAPTALQKEYEVDGTTTFLDDEGVEDE